MHTHIDTEQTQTQTQTQTEKQTDRQAHTQTYTNIVKRVQHFKYAGGEAGEESEGGVGAGGEEGVLLLERDENSEFADISAHGCMHILGDDALLHLNACCPTQLCSRFARHMRTCTFTCTFTHTHTHATAFKASH